MFSVPTVFVIGAGAGMRSLIYASAVTAALATGVISSGAQGPDKGLYELQERCGKRAAEVFAKEYGSQIQKTENGQIRFTYENHYSASLNKCFLLEIASSYELKQNTMSTSRILRLFDLNDNTPFGL
jgi:hypothetical protein